MRGCWCGNGSGTEEEEEKGEGGGLANKRVASAAALARRKAWRVVVVGLGVVGRDGMGWEGDVGWSRGGEVRVRVRERWWCSTWHRC